MSKVLVVCNDAGAATLLACWCQPPEGEYKYAVYGPAQSIFLKNKIEFTDESIESLLSRSTFDKVITGTGWMTDIEKKAIRYAVKNNIYCISAIDHWVNYEERFFLKGKYYYPNEIWVSDEYAFKIAKDLFDGSIKVVQQRSPLQWRVDKILKSKKTSEKKIFENETIIRILITMEPIRKKWINKKTDHAPEIESLFWLKNNLKGILKILDIDSQFRICLRPHPAENSNKYKEFIEMWQQSCGANLMISETEDIFEDIYQSHVVLGCETQALVIALLMKKQVGSILPPWAPTCSLPHTGIIHLRELAE